MKKTLIIIIFFLLTIIITFPSILFLKTKVIGDLGDAYQSVGFQFLSNRLFLEGKFPFGWTNYWRYPYGFNLQTGMDSSMVIITGLVLYRFIQNPILVYNLTIYIFIFLNLSLSYLSFRVLFPEIISLIGAIMYGLSFFSIARLGGHAGLMLTAGFPLILSSIILINREEGSKKSFTYLLLGLWFISFSSLQYPLIILATIPFLLIISLFTLRRELFKFLSVIYRKKLNVLIVMLLIFFSFILFHGQKIYELIYNQIPPKGIPIISPLPINYFIPNSYIRTISSLIHNNSNYSIEYSVFVGFVEMVLLIAALIFHKNTRYRLFLLLSISTFFILALGQQQFLKKYLPYQYLFHFFPYLGVTEPGRFFVIFYLFVVLSILLWLKRIKNNKLFFIILFLLIVERLPININLSPNMRDDKIILKLRNTKSNAILDLPISIEPTLGQIYDVYSIYYRKPIINGYIHWSGDSSTAKTLIKQLNIFNCNSQDVDKMNQNKKKQILYLLEKYGIRSVVIHKNAIEELKDCQESIKYNIQLLVEDNKLWNILYDDSTTKILWLKN